MACVLAGYELFGYFTKSNSTNLRRIARKRVSHRQTQLTRARLSQRSPQSFQCASPRIKFRAHLYSANSFKAWFLAIFSHLSSGRVASPQEMWTRRQRGPRFNLSHAGHRKTFVFRTKHTMEDVIARSTFRYPV